MGQRLLPHQANRSAFRRGRTGTKGPTCRGHLREGWAVDTSRGMVMEGRLRVAARVSAACGLVAVAAGAWTALDPGLLLGPAAMRGSARGTALVLVVVAVPLLLASMARAARGVSRRGGRLGRGAAVLPLLRAAAALPDAVQRGVPRPTSHFWAPRSGRSGRSRRPGWTSWGAASRTGVPFLLLAVVGTVPVTLLLRHAGTLSVSPRPDEQGSTTEQVLEGNRHGEVVGAGPLRRLPGDEVGQLTAGDPDP